MRENGRRGDGDVWEGIVWGTRTRTGSMRVAAAEEDAMAVTDEKARLECSRRAQQDVSNQQ
ncbi:hypothetical protein WT01_08540 [Burkholderia cepacia]|uniref:Uncharacterized protein n=1 Tax=Burkholderia cepacia TaxID=292 RepID=A0A103UKP3_BURCE|nr:hypothetical protein WS88_13770 [Burkholderia cepacia]KVK85557.1 hypothetical protein WS90_08895 [Burkholderia cepacia]KVL62926.1 hypothetical protein WT01_08540 [Burkholderia cepacia]